jgi:fatty acyl-CoA reductase
MTVLQHDSLSFSLSTFLKVLVEKLLRVTNVKKIYLLIRAKRGAQVHARLKDLLNARLFQK